MDPRWEKGTMKHFVPPGTKRYNETFCAARGKIAIDRCPNLGGSGIGKKKDPTS